MQLTEIGPGVISVPYMARCMAATLKIATIRLVRQGEFNWIEKGWDHKNCNFNQRFQWLEPLQNNTA